MEMTIRRVHPFTRCQPPHSPLPRYGCRLCIRPMQTFRKAMTQQRTKSRISLKRHEPEIAPNGPKEVVRDWHGCGSVQGQQATRAWPRVRCCPQIFTACGKRPSLPGLLETRRLDHPALWLATIGTHRSSKRSIGSFIFGKCYTANANCSKPLRTPAFSLSLGLEILCLLHSTNDSAPCPYGATLYVFDDYSTRVPRYLSSKASCASGGP
jgi:hypothetical protein